MGIVVSLIPAMMVMIGSNNLVKASRATLDKGLQRLIILSSYELSQHLVKLKSMDIETNITNFDILSRIVALAKYFLNLLFHLSCNDLLQMTCLTLSLITWLKRLTLS